jgi:hypothetical protein
MAKFRLGRCGAVALLGAACLPIAAADAATITETYDFSATFPAGAAVSTWDGSITITFDPTATGNSGPSALDAFSSNLPASYGTFVFIQSGNSITVGDDCVGGLGCIIESLTDKAAFNFNSDPSGVPTPIEAGISSTSTDAVITENLTMTLVPTSATPLPAGLPLFATGLGALGLLGWFRKRKVRASLLGAA